MDILGRHFYVIKQGRDALSVNHNNRSYMVGFSKPHLANLTRSKLGPVDSLYLQRKYIYDVTDEVNAGLKLMNITDIRVNKITMDTHAELTLYKATKGLCNDYDIEKVSTEDFLMYPIEKNIGIVMPYDYIEENSEVMKMTSNVVDPCDDFDRFKKSLKL